MHRVRCNILRYSIELTIQIAMGIVDLYSKRKKRAQGQVIDTYQYDVFPRPLRVQLWQIFERVLGNATEFYDSLKLVNATYNGIVRVLCHEYGEFYLSVKEDHPAIFQLRDFILSTGNVDYVLDAVELALRAIDRQTRKVEYRRVRNCNELADGAIEEVNIRMREHGVGYVFQNDEIMRVDSQLIHAEVVRPALQLLNVPGYEGVQDEYLAAHEHYRHGHAKEALVECLKAFESMMKVICAKRNWSVSGRGTAGDLIKAIFDNKLVPDFWQSHFGSLRSTLESGVPTARNKLAGHGQGAEPINVPNDIVAYMLHMTGAAIVLLSERDKALS